MTTKIVRIQICGFTMDRKIAFMSCYRTIPFTQPEQLALRNFYAAYRALRCMTLVRP